MYRRYGEVWHKDPAFRLCLTPLYLAVLFMTGYFGRWELQSTLELERGENLLECAVKEREEEGEKGPAPETLGITQL